MRKKTRKPPVITARDVALALTCGGLRAAFQPKIDIKARRNEGAETLARLNVLGEELPPSAFVPLAERNGLTEVLDLGIFARCCAAAKVLDKQNRLYGRLSCNLSPATLTSDGICAKLARIARDVGVPPSFLELEITESLPSDEQLAAARVRELRERGFTIAIDDFGKGFSGLSRLCALEIDVIKLDARFIRESSPRALCIVKNTVALARSLNAELVCEGVETAEHEKTLLAAGCRLAQGYLYSRPANLEILCGKMSKQVEF